MKKIISFSLWGDNPKYLVGALENIKTQKEFFINWKCRFYVHASVNSSWIDKLYKEEAEVILINENIDDEEAYATNKIHKGWFWRFEVLSDNTIDYVIVRDADSRLTLRDLNCVRDWIASKKEFHIIRDHVMHGVPICAGMWGATKNFISRIDYKSIRDGFNLQHNPKYGGYDQFFLARCIYPLVKYTACIHDDWDRYREGARKIPHFRVNNEFIGEPYEIIL
jgi:hypothetical protein